MTRMPVMSWMKSASGPEWIPNVKLDSNKVKWDDESGSYDDVESENEEDFLTRLRKSLGVNPK